MLKIDYCAIGQRIRSKRKELHLSQEELASRVGISVTHMSHIETGNTKLSLPVLVDIAKELGISTDQMLFDEHVPDDSTIRESMITLLNDCSNQEMRILQEVLAATKKALKTYS